MVEETGLDGMGGMLLKCGVESLTEGVIRLFERCKEVEYWKNVYIILLYKCEGIGR